MTGHAMFPHRSVGKGRNYALGWPLALMITCSLVVPQAWGNDPNAPLQGWFSGEVTVRADGRADLGPLSGVQGKVAELVKDEVSRLKFVPAQRSGVPATTVSSLRGKILLLPAEKDTFALALEHVSLMPVGSTPVEHTPPLYPRHMVRRGKAGAVEMLLQVDARGRVAEATTIMSTDPAFEKAVRDAARQWKFLPTGEETVFTVPVLFRMPGTRDDRLPAFQCAVLARNAHIAGQLGCVDRIEMSVRALKRVDISLP